tara:strand:+ start:4018 stop:4428 length:411 start_codon:yes stop_codon:yes gene_type:complete
MKHDSHSSQVKKKETPIWSPERSDELQREHQKKAIRWFIAALAILSIIYIISAWMNPRESAIGITIGIMATYIIVFLLTPKEEKRQFIDAVVDVLPRAYRKKLLRKELRTLLSKRISTLERNLKKVKELQKDDRRK